MRQTSWLIVGMAIGVIAGCSDELEDLPASSDAGEAIADSGQIDGSDAADDSDAGTVCEVGQALDGECVTEKLFVFLGARGDLLVSVSAVPESALDERERPEGTTINERCTLYSNQGFFTPEPFECPSLGSLVLSQGSDELEVPADESCYGAAPSKPWAGGEVTATWSGDALPGGSVSATLPDAPVVEVVTNADGGVTLTRANPEAWPTWILTLYSSDDQSIECDVEGTDVVEFTADEVAALTQGDVEWGLEALHNDSDGNSAAAGSLEVNLSAFSFATVADVL